MVSNYSSNGKQVHGHWLAFVHVIASTRQAIHLHRIIYGTKQDTLADHVHIGKKNREQENAALENTRQTYNN